MRTRSISIPWLSAGAVLALTACSDGSGPATPVRPADTSLRAASGQTGGGEGDALAAALLLSSGLVASHGILPRLPPGFSAIGERAAFHALDHLDLGARATGAGALLVGSARIRRLALEPGAPGDQNGNRTNLDETLESELARLLLATGAAPAPGAVPILFPFAEGSADLVMAPGGAGRAELQAWRTAPAPTGTVDLVQVGHALLARVLAATALTAVRRGNLVGADPQQGMLGLSLLQQAMAIEETLLRSLFFDGDRVGELRDPAAYDPASAPRWLPRTFRVEEDPLLPGAPASYVPEDRASELAALSSVLRASAELAWLGAPDNPLGNLRALFQGEPFGTAGPPVRPDGPDGPDDEVTFTRDIQPILQTNCRSCHGSPFPNSGYSVTTYEEVLAGGMWADPAVIPGDHARSPLWLIVVDEWTPSGRPFPIFRMPLGRLPLKPPDVQLIADWIDQGALKDPTVAPPPPQVGIDLTRVLFRNLRALHTTRATGAALHHRFVQSEVASGALVERSFFVDARATGEALSALAAVFFVARDEPGVAALLADAADRAVELLTTADGEVFLGYDLGAGVPVGEADLGAQAAIAAGLLAAGRVRGPGPVRARGIEVARVLVRDFFDVDSGLFDTERGRPARRYSPALCAVVLDALRESAAAGAVADAGEIHDRFVEALLPAALFSELDGLGEVLGDGVADTDENGIPEPALAGGAVGRAPLFAGVVVDGDPAGAPPGDAEVSWSRQVLPLLRSLCAECHLEGARRGDYRLDTPGLAATAGESGFRNLVVPGDPESSLLYRKIADHRPPVGAQMPLAKPPLDAAGRAVVFRWIAEGARDR